MNRFMLGGLSLMLASTIAVPAVKASEDQPEIRLNDVEQPVLTGADLVTHGASTHSIGGLALIEAPSLNLKYNPVLKRGQLKPMGIGVSVSPWSSFFCG